MKSLSITIVSVGFLALFVADVNATMFSGVAVGEWSNVVDTYRTPGDTDRDIWMIDNSDDLVPEVASFEWGTVDGANNTSPYPNEFRFDGEGSDGLPYVDIDSESDNPFLIGMFDYYNGTVYNADGIFGVDLDVGFSIYDIAGDYLDEVTITGTFGIINTPNIVSPTDTTYLAVDDVVRLQSSAVSKLFNYGNKWYEFTILGFSDVTDPGPPVIDFGSPEGGTAKAGLYAQITEVPVPEPSTLVLFGAGLLGLAGLRFKKKKEA